MLFLNVLVHTQLCVHSKWLKHVFLLAISHLTTFFEVHYSKWVGILLVCEGMSRSVDTAFTYAHYYDNSCAYFLVAMETKLPSRMCREVRRWWHLSSPAPQAKAGPGSHELLKSVLQFA